MAFRDVPLPPEQFFVQFLAPVPVGHRVLLEFHQADVGFLGTKLEVRREWPLITDEDTGIVWGSGQHFGQHGFDPKAQKPTVERVRGVVRGCFVNDGCGGSWDQTSTMLLVEVQSRGP